jgi:citrate lyase beta subunit
MLPSHAYLAPLLYVPADRPGLEAMLSGGKDLGVCSLAVCLEDAVRSEHRREAATALAHLLHQVEQPAPRAIFVRPADADLLSLLLDTGALRHVQGVLVPKATPARISQWANLTRSSLPLLPILETREALDPMGRRELAAACDDHRAVIPFVRVGANDLFALLGGLRRPRGRTVYETPVGRVVDELLEIFISHGFSLSGCVFDRLNDPATLARECEEDALRGIFRKTALNPRQVADIWQTYLPAASEVEEAQHILHPDAPAVFGMNGSMHEAAVHGEWARRLLERDAIHRAADLHFNADLLPATFAAKTQSPPDSASTQ